MDENTKDNSDNNYEDDEDIDNDNSDDSIKADVKHDTDAVLDKRQIMLLREKTHMLEPVIRIGKNGINDNVIKEIATLLKKRRLLKIKVLKNSLENNELDGLISEVTKKTSSTLIVKIGLTFCIYK